MGLTDKDIVRIGDQMWMRSNLKASADPSRGIYEDGGETFFTWDAAVKAAESVGDGWRLPTVADWKKLTEYCGGKSKAGRRVKSSSGWETAYEGKNGTDDVGFCGRPLGYYSPGCKMVIYQGVSVGYWSSDFDDYVDEYGEKRHEPIYWALEAHHYGFGPGSIDGRVGHCVRLVKDCERTVEGLLRDTVDGYADYLRESCGYKVDVGGSDGFLVTVSTEDGTFVGRYGVSVYGDGGRYSVSFLVGKDDCVIPFSRDEKLCDISSKLSDCFHGFLGCCERTRYMKVLGEKYSG